MILMYHHVGCGEKISSDRAALEGWKFTISPEAFRKQLQSFQNRGFQFISLSHYVDSLKLPFKLRAKQIAITFDDGWLDNHEYALPILTSLNLTATFYIVTGEMPGIDRSKRMNVWQLQELVQAGMDIGGHSVTHPNLATLEEEKLRYEFVGCKQQLEQQLGIEVRHFAYPGGRFNRLVVEQCEKAGYSSAVCSIGWGMNDELSRFRLFRETIDFSSSRLKNALKTCMNLRRLMLRRANNRVLKMMR